MDRLHHMKTQRHLSTSRSRRNANSSFGAVAVACTACRSRHLKCDGRKPCNRCLGDRAECSYIRSRRGRKASRSKLDPSVSSSLDHTMVISMVDAAALDSSTLTRQVAAVNPSSRFPFELIEPPTYGIGARLIPPPAAHFSTDASPQGLRTAFYEYFFPAHPFVLPPGPMMDLIHLPEMAFLDLALQYIGAFYVQGVSLALADEFTNMLRRAHDSNIYLVQALMLRTIGLHMADDDALSITTLKEAVDIALDLGINQAEFAQRHGDVHTVLGECCRRTWWELYVLDGLTGGVIPQYEPRLGLTLTDMPYPVEDNDYLSGQMATATIRNCSDYREAVFTDLEIIFSSATYKIEAARIIHTALTANKAQDTTGAEQIDTQLTNWMLHLPEVKAKVVDETGRFDAVMAFAHFMIAACSILVHRPRSDLTGEDSAAITTCIKNHNIIEPAACVRNIHTSKAIQAARDICALIRSPLPLARHSPYFTCAITMAAVTYLSYWSFIATEEMDSRVKSHIELQVGSLKQLAKALPIASTILNQVRGVAREIFRSRKALSNAYHPSITREQIFCQMLDDTNGSSYGSDPSLTLS